MTGSKCGCEQPGLTGNFDCDPPTPKKYKQKECLTPPPCYRPPSTDPCAYAPCIVAPTCRQPNPPWNDSKDMARYQKAYADTTQKRIQNVVRVSSSEYAMNLASVNVCEKKLDDPLPNSGFGYSAPQSTSDRREFHIVLPSMNIPRRRTKAWPGQTSAPGKGVDVKHFSYARYLARKKGCGALKGKNCPNINSCDPSYKDISSGSMGEPPLVATTGGKYRKFGIISGCGADPGSTNC